MQVKNLGFGAYPVKDLTEGLNLRINEKYYDPESHGKTATITNIKHRSKVPSTSFNLKIAGKQTIKDMKFLNTEVLDFLDILA